MTFEDLGEHPGWMPMTEDRENHCYVVKREFEYPRGASALLWAEMREQGNSGSLFAYQAHVSLPFSAGPEVSSQSATYFHQIRPYIAAYERILTVPLRLRKAGDAAEVKEALRGLQAPYDAEDEERAVYHGAFYLMACIFDMPDPLAEAGKIEAELIRLCCPML